ncbi:MAG TPA: hypothetical protein VNA16_03715, partial [Abditibacteriaceae bacterium]|nr:hypothetical protein [Abditibacteriaceae bacterium]
MSFIELTAYQLAGQIKTHRISCREVTDEFLHHIEAVESDVKAFVTLLPDEARRRADALDRR